MLQNEWKGSSARMGGKNVFFRKYLLYGMNIIKPGNDSQPFEG